MSENKDLRPASHEKRRRLNPKKLWLLLAVLGATAVFFGFYEYMLRTEFFPYVMWSYMGVFSVLLIVFLACNRGLLWKRMTPEMLPEEWTEEQKEDYFSRRALWLKRTFWMVIPLGGIALTLLIDAMRLFLPEFFGNLFMK